MTWPIAEPIHSRRLRLVPLAVDHADQMVDVLADPSLYAYTGGEAPTREQLHRRYTAQTVGHSADGTEGWLNWVIAAHNRPERFIGYVQATVTERESIWEADIAWVVGREYQRRGLATEAAGAMMQWLRTTGVERLIAHIDPAHSASARVAQKLRLAPTGTIVDGETRWQSQ